MDGSGKIDLTIYMLKADVDLSKAIKVKGIKPQDLPIKGGTNGKLYVKQAVSKTPRWAKFFSSVMPIDAFGKNRSAGALLVVEGGGRSFAISFGQGRYLIESEFLETNFGLKVTLNYVDENSLRSIDKTSFEAHPRQSREQSGKATQVQYFGIDIERDLLRAVTGVPVDPYWGERISGKDSVKLSVEITLDGVPQLLKNLLKGYASDAYKKKGFAFVDHINEVRDPVLADELDIELLQLLQQKKFDKIWLAVPDIVDWDSAVGFKYSSASKAPRVYDVRLEQFLETLGNTPLTIDLLMRRKILCVDADDTLVLERPAYFYIYAELAYKNNTYLLNSGKWYAMDDAFVAQVQHFYENIPHYNKLLPPFEEKDKTEAVYNKKVAASDKAQFALLDQDNIRLPGAVSPVEPCDLYRKPREFIHVKRYGGSSVLSHLFNQGLVSAELFKSEPLFRKAFNDKLPAAHKLKDIGQLPGQNEYKVVYAIISEYEEDLSIPFFSKISLRHAVNRLRAIGFAVEIGKIPVEDELKVLKVLPPQHKQIRKSKRVAAKLGSDHASFMHLQKFSSSE